jgi:hypothetical protein
MIAINDPRIANQETVRPERGWLSRYEAFTRVMYAVRRFAPGLPAAGISLLHPRHTPPPEHLRMAELLASDGLDGAQQAAAGAHLPSRRWLAGRWLRCAVFACRDTLQILWLKLRLGRRLTRAMREPATVVMKTWAFSANPPHGAPDFYYGSLPQQLEERGVPCVLVCGDGRGFIDGRFARNVLHPGRIRAVPETLLIPLWAPLVTAWRQWLTALALRRLAKRQDDVRLALACSEASRGSVQPFTMRNAMAFYIARTAVSAWRPQAFITLYEGQPWELPARLGAKAADGSCVTVGYQHTVLMPHSFSLLSPPRGEAATCAVPDVVLCLGERTRAMMAPGHKPLGNRLAVFGTYRKMGGSDRLYAPQPERRTVLVLPEGIQSEAQALFNFAMRMAALRPEVRFIFRCHPVLPFERVRAALADSPERWPNIELSTQAAITEDFKRSSAVLYRGSSAVLYAVLYGLKPVYLHDPRYPDVDPLFELDGWREFVASTEQMAETLERYSRRPDLDAWREAAAYVLSYVSPVDEASIGRLLDAIGLSSVEAAGR